MENTMSLNTSLTLEGLNNLEESCLVACAQQGDLEAFNQLVLLYQDMIYSLARRILGDDDLAADITQNTFLSAYRNLGSFRNGSFRSWLYRITVNNCYTEHRRSKRHPQLSLDYEDDGEERPLPQEADFPGTAASPEKLYEQREMQHLLLQALGRLEADHRAVVTMIDLHDFDYHEAAQALGVPVGTVKSRLARARVKLRQMLDMHLSGLLN